MTRQDLLERYSAQNNDMNVALYGLYQKIPNEFSEYVNKYNANNTKKITNPFYIAASDHYFNAQKKVMIVAQETYGWFSEGEADKDFKGLYSKHNSINELQSLYNKFVNIDHGYNSPIWRLYRHLFQIAETKGIGIINNNIAKVGYVRGYNGYDYTACSYLQFIVRKEIEICKPDLLLFITGPRYDVLINETLGQFQCEDELGIGVNKFARLSFTDNNQLLAYRTYHPAYLQRQNKTSWSKKVYEKLDDIILKV